MMQEFNVYFLKDSKNYTNDADKMLGLGEMPGIISDMRSEQEIL